MNRRDKCKWYVADVPGHFESACGVWVEATLLHVVFAQMAGTRCRKCGKKIVIGIGRLNKDSRQVSDD